MTVRPPPAGIERRVLDTARGSLAASRAGPAAYAGNDESAAGQAAGAARTGGAGETGAGTVVVTVSGYVGSKEDFWPLLPRVAAAGYEAWAYDQLGQFESPGPDDPGAYAIGLLAEDLREVIAQAGGGRPVHLLGHCLGGFVARAAALADPSAVRSLALVGCGPSLTGRRHRRMLADLESKLDSDGFEALWSMIKQLVPAEDVAKRGFWRSKLRATSPGFMLGTALSLGAERDRGPELRASGVPVLILHGSKDTRLWSRDTFAATAAALGAELVVIDGAAHSPGKERPEPTAEALLRFWSRTDRMAPAATGIVAEAATESVTETAAGAVADR